MDYDISQYNSSKNVKNLINCTCHYCNKKFKRTRLQIYISIKRNQKNLFCSKNCLANFSKKYPDKTFCKNCGGEINGYLKFCNKSCAAIHNNANKNYGNRKSKLEIWLNNELIKIYPKLKFKFNSKEEINSELDIYIPSLKLAFEINGVFHYEPIYGNDKLKQIKNNDNRKFQACLEKNIELCIINTSDQIYFKEKTSQKYLKIITNIINNKMVAEERFELSRPKGGAL
jgi:hypothetical protein